MALNPKADGYFDQVLKVVESEPTFAARILATANSAVAGARSPITTVRSALTRIGSLSASNLILAVAVSRVFVPRNDWEKSLWRHALQVALAARGIAQRSRDPDLDPEEAYVAGLLHDIGRFVMFQVAPEKLRRIEEGEWDSPQQLVEIERSICGLTHTDLGAIACANWGLPDTIIGVVRDHHGPVPSRPAGRAAKLTALIRLADIAMFPSAMPGTPGLGEADEATIERVLVPKLPPFLRLDAAELGRILRSVAAEADAIARSLGVA